MRTAVLRIDVDPAGELSPAQLADGLPRLRTAAGAVGAEVLDGDLASRTVGKREIQILIGTDDADAAVRTLLGMCGAAFGVAPAPGAVTFVSRGTDEDARGVLAGFGLDGEISRTVDADGFDVVEVTVREDDLARVPESRIHTALEASLNCEVRILTR